MKMLGQQRRRRDSARATRCGSLSLNERCRPSFRAPDARAPYPSAPLVRFHCGTSLWEVGQEQQQRGGRPGGWACCQGAGGLKAVTVASYSQKRVGVSPEAFGRRALFGGSRTRETISMRHSHSIRRTMLLVVSVTFA